MRIVQFEVNQCNRDVFFTDIIALQVTQCVFLLECLIHNKYSTCMPMFAHKKWLFLQITKTGIYLRSCLNNESGGRIYKRLAARRLPLAIN